MTNKNIKKCEPIQFDNLKDYIDVYLQILCSFVDEEYKLSYKEREFLAHCIIYQYNGGNLTNFTEMHDYMVNIKFCSDRQHVSTYKQKLSIKKWVKTGKYTFSLAPSLNFKPGQDLSAIFNIQFKNNKNAGLERVDRQNDAPDNNGNG